MTYNRLHKVRNAASLGVKGWIGLRLDDERIDWIEVVCLLRTAYRLLAPKRLRVMM